MKIASHWYIWLVKKITHSSGTSVYTKIMGRAPLLKKVIGINLFLKAMCRGWNNIHNQVIFPITTENTLKRWLNKYITCTNGLWKTDILHGLADCVYLHKCYNIHWFMDYTLFYVPFENLSFICGGVTIAGEGL
jgi:hypothetical protein